MADWEEIKRLAADFQRAQLSSTVQRLSERNCVEIVQRLVELQLLDVIFTTDGKEYLTPDEINKEIKEELLVHNGRINLVELQKILGVDFCHVEAKVNEVVRENSNLNLVLGQIIENEYMDNVCEEINDKLHEQGYMALAGIAMSYDLPAEFLLEAIEARMGSVIHGKLDEVDRNILYTEAYVVRYKARIRGAFTGLTRPVPVINTMHSLGMLERLFFSILEDLVKTNRLAGSLTSGQRDKIQYIPNIYTRSQNAWLDSFYKQNGYLEYDAVSRLGFTDPKGFIKKRLSGDKLMYLSSCCVGRAMEDQVEAYVEEALSDNTWADIAPNLPSMFSDADVNQLIQKSLKSHPDSLVFCDTIVTSPPFISTCREPFQKLMLIKADKDAKLNASLLSAIKPSEDGVSAKDDKKDQRRKKAAGSGKGGGGSQGREGKTKSSKKKKVPTATLR